MRISGNRLRAATKVLTADLANQCIIIDSTLEERMRTIFNLRMTLKPIRFTKLFPLGRSSLVSSSMLLVT
ncbi:MAG: hypothetical protein IPH59_10570 [bacterium]|nr:hypothetical protein [bacterium]